MFARMIKSFVNTPGMLSGLASRQPARFNTLLRNAAVRGLVGALKICPGLPSS